MAAMPIMDGSLRLSPRFNGARAEPQAARAFAGRRKA